jgi:hypothetical protein
MLCMTKQKIGAKTAWLPDCLTAKLLLVLASSVVLDSESHGTHDHILLSDDSRSLQTLHTGGGVLHIPFYTIDLDYVTLEIPSIVVR